MRTTGSRRRAGSRPGRLAALFGLALALACGSSGTTLHTSFPDNRPEHISALLERLPEPADPREPANGTGSPLVAVELQGEPSGLAVFDPSGGQQRWRRELPVSSGITIGGPVVIVRSEQAVLGLSVETGETLWQHRGGSYDYMGAAVEGDLAVLSYSTAGDRASSFREGKVVALDAGSGRVRWTLGPVQAQLGGPAISGGVVFVPWDRHSISALDGGSGEEIARLLSRDDVYSFVEAGPAGVFYGASAAYRLSERSATGSRDESLVYEPLVGNAPSNATFGPDSFLGSEGGRTARNKIRFLWRGAAGDGGEVQLVDDRLYFLYYRIVFAFDAPTGEVRWARSIERDAEAAAVVPGGLVLLDGRGDLIALDAGTGAAVHRASLGSDVAAAAFDLGELPRGDGGEPPRTSPVREQLSEIILDPDTRLTPARRFAVSVLASIPEAEATRDLLAVCRDRRVPEPVRDDAAMVLRTRQAGLRYLIDALDEHHDFLAEGEAPPVGVIAAAVLHQRDESAVPRLLDHLEDPETPFEDLSPLAAALTELGDASMVPRLRRYVVLYHADSEFRGRTEPLLELVRAIARHGSDDDRAAMAALADDPRILAGLARGLGAALAQPEPTAPEEDAEAPAAAPEIAPARVGEVMQDARDQIRPCVQSALRRRPGLEEIRLSMVINELGELVEITVTPQDDVLGSCLTLSLAGSSFPRGADRRRAEYTIEIRDAEE